MLVNERIRKCLCARKFNMFHNLMTMWFDIIKSLSTLQTWTKCIFFVFGASSLFFYRPLILTYSSFVILQLP